MKNLENYEEDIIVDMIESTEFELTKCLQELLKIGDYRDTMEIVCTMKDCAELLALRKLVQILNLIEIKDKLSLIAIRDKIPIIEKNVHDGLCELQSFKSVLEPHLNWKIKARTS